jgi:predicted metal-dependent phosphoesterase TrpH
MHKLKIDFHIHTDYSDSVSSLEDVLKAVRKRNLDRIAITDHGTITASIYAAQIVTDLIVIPGVEIETCDGHILVLGVKNPPSRGLSVADVVEYARKEGGLIIIPHPGIPFIGVNEEAIRRIKPDAIETHNAKTPLFRYFVNKNTKLANNLGLPKTGGSDAHSFRSVGDAYTIVEVTTRNVDGVLEAVRRGRTQPEGKATPLRENIKTSLQALQKRIF